MSINIYNDLYTIQGAQAREDVIFQPGTFKVTMATLHHGKPRNEHPIGDFIQRIFRSGTLQVFTAGDNPEIIVRGLPHATRIKEIIEEQKTYSGINS